MSDPQLPDEIWLISVDHGGWVDHRLADTEENANALLAKERKTFRNVEMRKYVGEA